MNSIATQPNKAAELNLFIANVARMLNDGFIVSDLIKDDGFAVRWIGYITRQSDGLNLRFAFDEYGNKGKIAISGSSGDLNGGRYVTAYNEMHQKVTYPSINVTMSKTTEQVAKDIKKRMLDECNRVHGYVLKKIKNDNQFLFDRDSATQRLAAEFGSKAKTVYNHPEQLTYEVDPYVNVEKFKQFGYGEFKVNSATSVELKLNGLTLDVACKVAEALKKIFSA